MLGRRRMLFLVLFGLLYRRSVAFLSPAQGPCCPTIDLTASARFESTGPGDHDSTKCTDPSDQARRRLVFSILAGASTPQLRILNQEVVAAMPTTEIPLQTPEFRGIIKPPLDKNDYVTYTLENGLRVLLCSDSTSNQAAAAMDVHVGACSDPVQVPGLAHFTEHMLFLGTKKYPKEDSFESFLATQGGTSNAFTDSENTVYYFSLGSQDLLDEGLSRFGAFFSSPLFTESATGRELNAIESENAKNLQSDIFRNYQITKGRANPEHPFSKFFTGNKYTLLDAAKEQGINVREELIKFYNRYYSANQMTLAIVAPQSIEELKKMVNLAFAEIPNRNVGKPEEAWAGTPPFQSVNSIIPSFGHVVEIVPVSDLRQVVISWPMQYASNRDRDISLLIKPSEYVGHLLGHEGPSSLLSNLKRRGLANSLGCAAGEELSDFEVFDVSIGLTTQGLVAVDKVVEAVYSYLRMLKEQTIPDYVLKEVLQLQELQWRFLTKGNPGGYVQSLCTSMQRYPPALYIAGPRRLALDEYAMDPKLSSLPRSSFSTNDQLSRTRVSVDKYVERLSVDNSMVTVLSKTFDGQTTLRERWYGTNYNVKPIPETFLASWRDCAAPQKLRLAFPTQNQFIPSEAGLRVKIIPSSPLKAGTIEERLRRPKAPRLIRDDGDDGQWQVYFKEDDVFGKPQGYVVFQVLTKDVYRSSMNAALASFYETCVSDKLGEYAYDAMLAGLTYEVRILPRGVRLTFGGYNDKLKKFAAFVTRKLTADLKDILPKDYNEFDRYKDQIMRSLSAFDVKQPYTHASYYSQLAIQPRRFQYTNRELREATRKTTLPDLVAYAEAIWSNGKGLALIQGNFDERDALELVKNIGDALPFRPITANDLPPRLEALPLPSSPALILPPRLLITEPNPSNENAVSHVMLQCLEKSERQHVLIEMLGSIIEEPFYNELRTKKQLGYIVASGLKGLAETRSLSFVVQSNVATSDELTLAILSFLDRAEKEVFEKLSQAEVAVYAKSLIEKKTEPDRDLAIEVTRNWSEIASGRLQFDRLQQEAAALLTVKKEDVQNCWKSLYSGDGRRVLITQMIPASSGAPPATTGYGRSDVSSQSFSLGIDDIEEFRRVREPLVYDRALFDFPKYTSSPQSNQM